MKQLIAFALLIIAAPALAQSPASASQAAPDRWAAWRGCWQLSEESVADVAGLLTSDSPSTANATGRVCVAPAADGSATLTTLVSDKAVQTETIVPDGKRHALSDPGCRGTQQAEWSHLGPRIYARTDVACGDQPMRVVSGFSAVVAGPLWLDIQLIESGGRKSMRVRRYRPAVDRRAATASPAQEISALPLGGRISIPEIKEAATKVAPETLQAIVLELGAGGYDLNARRLIELDDAGVPDTVIDLMVAMSFPKKFVVEHAAPSSGPGAFGDEAGLWGPFAMWPYYAHPRYYSSYYSPFGYYNWGYYDPYYYYPPGVVIINPGPGGGGVPEPSGAGRVVDGHGYTRIRPNVPDAPARTSDGLGGSNSASSSSGSNSGSNSGGSVSTGGYSGGGGGGERVAVPRPPGGR